MTTTTDRTMLEYTSTSLGYRKNMPPKAARTPCYGCGEKRRRKGSHFCSQRCAAGWAEAIADGNDDTEHGT